MGKVKSTTVSTTPREATGFDRWVAARIDDDPRFAKALVEDRALIARVDVVVTALRSVLDASGVPLEAFARSLAKHPQRLAKMEKFLKAAERTVVAAAAPAAGPMTRLVRTVRVGIGKRHKAPTALAHR